MALVCEFLQAVAKTKLLGQVSKVSTICCANNYEVQSTVVEFTAIRNRAIISMLFYTSISFSLQVR